MMHESRNWQVSVFEGTASEFAHELGRITWTPCQGFKFGNLLYLNDATSPDGAQEYAVIRLSDNRQIESLTVSWMSPDGLLKAVESLPTSDYRGWEPFGYERIVAGEKLADHLHYNDHACGHCY